MFKKKIRILNGDWELIEEYRSYTKPNVGEFIYSGKHKKYFLVLRVIHSIDINKLEIVVEEHENKK